MGDEEPNPATKRAHSDSEENTTKHRHVESQATTQDDIQGGTDPNENEDNDSFKDTMETLENGEDNKGDSDMEL